MPARRGNAHREWKIGEILVDVAFRQQDIAGSLAIPDGWFEQYWV